MSVFLAGRLANAGAAALLAAVAVVTLMPEAHARSQFLTRSTTQTDIILVDDDDDDDDRRGYFHRDRDDGKDRPRYRGFSRDGDDDDDDDD